MNNSLKTLISKLNDSCRRAAERAAAICMSKGHYEVDVEHVLLALLEQPRCDFAILCHRFNVTTAGITRDLEAEVDKLRAGNARTPVFSAHLPSLLEHAWLIASLDTQAPRIRSGHLLLALLTEARLKQLALRSSPLFARFSVDEMKHKFDELTAGSEEARLAPSSPPDSERNEPEQSGSSPALDQFTTNLTERARSGTLDPVIGREAEIRLTIDILMRRRQNNPILTGEAGVGKTAVVEGLAARIAAGEVPAALQGVALHVLDMGLLQAGASVKGEFENRLKNVIDEVKKSPHPIVLFIDEAHTMIGAGGPAGQSDAANLLKPALARGELRTIAATTWAEYKRYFEKDAALARRFQVVKVEEPSEPVAAAMLRGMSGLMEKHFNVRVIDEAITEAVRLSARYITGRQLPDKAIGVLDTACARVALAQSSVPGAMEDIAKLIDRLDAEITALQREAATGAGHGEKVSELAAHRAERQQALDVLTARHAAEKALVEEIRQLRTDLEVGCEPQDMDGVKRATAPTSAAMARSGAHKPGKAAPATPLSAAQKALHAKVAALAELQGEQPLIPLQVDGHVVAEIVSAWTGIPLGKMIKDEIHTVLGLVPMLQARVIGQDHALDAVAQRVRTARAQLDDPNKPKAVFLFAGPSGVGKTETALALAEALYGGEKKLITINMSEYQEAHSVSGLKGSPPGYVGYGEGGVLTEAVRRNPYTVVLLDEVEKAHPDVLELFFQVFDKGFMDDAEGREIDFRNTVIILTSNAGSSQIMQACLNKPAPERPSAGDLAQALRPVLFKQFKPAFLGRLEVVPFYPIDDDVLERIVRLKLQRIGQRVAANHRATFEFDEKLVQAVLARCTEVDSGARNVDHILGGSLLPGIAEHALVLMAQGRALERIKVSAVKNGDFKYSVA